MTFQKRLYLITLLGVCFTLATTLAFVSILFSVPALTSKNVDNEEQIVSQNVQANVADIPRMYKKDLSDLTLDTTLFSDRRYLLPVGLTGGGPNFLYKHFKIATRFALFLNRTIVLTPFMRHRLRLNSTLARVPFKDTFHSARLAKLLPVTDLSRFIRDCDGISGDVLQAPHLSPHPLDFYTKKYKHAKNVAKFLLGVSLPSEGLVVQNEEEAIERFHRTNNLKCLAMYYPYNFRNWTIPNMESLALNVSKHLKRSRSIVEAVDVVEKKICNGKPFLAFHWRNKTGEQCTAGHRAERNDPNCPTLISSIISSGSMITRAIQTVMKSYGVSCIYVSYVPMYSEAIIGILAKRITQIFSGNDVIRNLPASSALTTDEYMMSLLEQEICYRSAVFIGVDYSNWSDFIFDERQAEGRPSYHLNELPGVPEELASSMYF